MRSIYFYVNGILNFPGCSSNWTGRAVTHTILHSRHPAEKIEYLSFATVSRWFGQRARVKKLARTLSFYEGWDITLVAHSNGAAVVLEALRYLDWPKVNTVHLFSPACERDFALNGMQTAQRTERIRDVHVYVAGQDWAMQLASTWFGKVFGYGNMGRIGPVNFIPEKTSIIRRSDWGHSDWWSDSNFPWAMNQILKNET